MENVARNTGIALTVPMLAIAIFSMGCYCADGYDAYASDLTNATIDASSPTIVPLTISVPAPAASGGIGVEVHVEDCRAGGFEVGTRLLRADATTPATTIVDLFPSSTGMQQTLSCPNRPVVFGVSPSEMTCTAERCTADLRVELTSTTGVGPREVEVRLVKFNGSSCHHEETLRTDGRIDSWGE